MRREPIARDPLRRGARHLVGDEGAPAGEHDNRRDRSHEPHGAIPGHHGDEHRHGEERDQARLRVREDEAREEEDGHERREQHPDLAVPHRRQHDRHREHNLAPVEARVAKRDVTLKKLEYALPIWDRRGVEDQPLGRLLDQANEREDRRQRDSRVAEGAWHPGGERRSPDDDDQHREGRRKYCRRFCAAASAVDQSTEREANANERSSGTAISRGSAVGWRQGCVRAAR